MRNCALPAYDAGVGGRRPRQSSSDFGRRLDAHLTTLGLTPLVLAQRTGLSPSHVYQLLRGDRPDPRGTTLHRIASALGVDEAELAQPIDTLSAASLVPSVDKTTFFALMSAFPSGVTIVTTLDQNNTPRGLTCTATCSLSAEPPLVLVCIDQRSGTLSALRARQRFVINYLLAGRAELANRFATAQVDRWATTAWRPTRTGLPHLHADSLAFAECHVLREVSGGDHVIVIGRVVDGEPPAPGSRPMLYFRRDYPALSTP